MELITNSKFGHIIRLIVPALTLAALIACGESEDKRMSQDLNRQPGGDTPRNHLANETSPYLLQHADNPVDWYPWGEEALAKAKAEDKPIFLSIGYSACHWCHVMEHESFENDSIAAIMNEHFVNIKVDREERPDLDGIYMTFVQMTTGGGGWPMSVFLTPEGKPFFGGTYFPPQDAHGRRGFSNILLAVAEAWQEDRSKILESSDTAVSYLQQSLARGKPADSFPQTYLEKAVDQTLERYDPINGGFGSAPKFPPSYQLVLLLKEHQRTGNDRLLKAVTYTLDKMAYGGMYDQLGGGFHRYSVDARWLIPHFEKMLYDNAQLAVAYFEAFRATGNPFYERIGREILDYVLRDMTDNKGGFHSAEDADSEGEEGKFYVWTPEQVIGVLGDNPGKMFCDYYGVTSGGNFENNTSVLHIRVEPQEFAQQYHISVDELEKTLSQAKTKLLTERNKRVRPGKDDKVLADWNGMMLSAFAAGYQVSGEEKYLNAAVKCAHFIESTMIDDDQLMHVYRKGQTGQAGFLTDYAFVANGLVDLYEASFNIRWLKLADKLASKMVATFFDETNGGFYLTRADQTDLVIRQKDSYDGATPSGNSEAALVLFRLAVLLGKSEYSAKAEKTLLAQAPGVEKMPSMYMNLLNAYHFSHFRPREIAIVGVKEDVATEQLLAEVYREYVPNRVVTFLDTGSQNGSETKELIPLLRERTLLDGKSTAYVCENYTCKRPVTSPRELAKQLAE